MILKTSWQSTGPLQVLVLFAIGLVLLAVFDTVESLFWIFPIWVLQAPFLHTLETSHFSLNCTWQTIVFMASFPSNWLVCVGWNLLTLDTIIWEVRFLGGLGRFQNFKSWIWMEIISLVQYPPPYATIYPLYKYLTSAKTSSQVSFSALASSD